jgi:uncharacterized protein (TIGR02246 family)
MFTTQKKLLVGGTAIALVLGAMAMLHRTPLAVHAQFSGAAAQPAKGAGQDDDRAALAKAARSFAAAFEKGDAKALAAHWTENGEYTADDGTVFRGRKAIESEYAELFASRKGKVKLDIDIDTVRFPSRDTAIEEGHVKVRVGKDQAVVSKYSVLHVRENGKWLMAVVREWPGEGTSLRDLDWLIGTWSAKNENAEVLTQYEWWGNKGFIRMNITIKGKDRTATGFQMIGRDASTGQLRSWTFDPDGSFGEASWSRDGKKWVLDSAAVHENGEVHTATNILTHLDDNTFTFQSVKRTVGDRDAPDIAPVRVTRVKAKN